MSTCKHPPSQSVVQAGLGGTVKVCTCGHTVKLPAQSNGTSTKQ